MRCAWVCGGAPRVVPPGLPAERLRLLAGCPGHPAGGQGPRRVCLVLPPRGRAGAALAALMAKPLAQPDCGGAPSRTNASDSAAGESGAGEEGRGVALAVRSPLAPSSGLSLWLLQAAPGCRRCGRRRRVSVRVRLRHRGREAAEPRWALPARPAPHRGSRTGPLWAKSTSRGSGAPLRTLGSHGQSFTFRKGLFSR